MARWYGSFQNRLMENMSGQPDPVVGMGCTEVLWSDREPFEVIAVKDVRHCTARAMKTKLIGGAYTNDWEITPDENGYTVELFRKKNGQWVQRYADRSYGNRFVMGYADKNYDWSF